MKKFYVFAVACVALLATACGNKEAKEEAVDTLPVVEEVVVEEAVDSVAPDTVQVAAEGAEVVEAAAE